MRTRWLDFAWFLALLAVLEQEVATRGAAGCFLIGAEIDGRVALLLHELDDEVCGGRGECDLI
jgi:hypothetical protein